MNDQQIMHRPGTLELRRQQLDYILLDGSASMQDKWWDTLAALDAYIAGIREANVDSHVLLKTFTTVGEALTYDTARDVATSAWTSFTADPIGAHFGSTPLYDAIHKMGVELRDLDPTRCAITIATDGEENMSRTTETQARGILDWCRAKGWQVTFIGCDFNNSRTAKMLGAQPSSAIGVQKSLLTEAARNLAKKRANYALYGAPMHWSEEEQQQFGGYLTHTPEA